MENMGAVRVGVIEDHVDNMELIVSLLTEDLGIQPCVTASTGTAFFDWVANHPADTSLIDVIFLDLHIPRENGYDILARLRAMPGIASAKVIAVTANVMRTDIDAARQAGFDGFLGKPISVTRFPGQVQRILAGEYVWEPR